MRCPLTPCAAYEKRVKTQRLKLEMSQARKDVEFFMSKVDAAESISKMEARKSSSGKAEAAEAERAKVLAMLPIL